ncbi:4-hydroxythreonine-4-phosphate dehydrogenase PdxA [Nordella sp. HKS 07]|uniref:4-hydroxythreonine-4-phosphate dehydrogenase PdxA n=1 Tax=Nordella sp. HKS 07 TaxID=2712222 RepID=UPI0013E1EFFA|nr:4-hydroxythreonine-4-phosphate dehydrogenase PdxA [Nordella sp. HKS 07]QIG50690.1 4-hydroxythreonine-4-phosphate dehydrogenase PdxA [Nordella sp. HKS 07]
MTARREAPLLAVTIGEPGGIGPDITAEAWLALRSDPDLAFFLIGDSAYLDERFSRLGAAVPIRKIALPAEARGIFPTALPVIDLPFARRPDIGRFTAETAGTVIGAIDMAVAMALEGDVVAIVTNPIQKEALYAAGFTYQGHTDYLAHLALRHGHQADPVMMLCAQDLRAIPITVHIALAEVPRQLSGDLIIRQARVVSHDLKRRFGIASPRLAFTGLNPHAGENGAMGLEEQTIIAPALAQLRAEGLIVQGPLPADTAFHAEARAQYDAILCMYHDQALIPVKTLDFHGGVNCTLGLPFIRTSPDHGTALSLAGSGKANPRSLMAAISLAADIARRGAAA